MKLAQKWKNFEKQDYMKFYLNTFPTSTNVVSIASKNCYNFMILVTELHLHPYKRVKPSILHSQSTERTEAAIEPEQIYIRQSQRAVRVMALQLL
jgi:hypothetical protein